ncbi:ABC transporter permease [Microbacterium sp. LWH12-1.2]|uniref:ABC transporter permease n=1 Tax=Microbacterium sp. LWH12-1.2 TaxID=3135259 RepID=UPI00342BF93B
MIPFVRGEFRRLFATRLVWWSLLTAALCGGLLPGLIAVIGPENANPPLPGLDTGAGVEMLLSLTSVLLFVPALIGTVAITSEYRHRTVGTTFLLAPRRVGVVLAKLVVYALFGLAYGVIASASAAAAVAGGAALHGETLGMPWSELVPLLVRLALAAAIYMIIGVAIGALARHQLIAIGVTLGYFYVLEYVLMLIPGVNTVYPFLPGGATAALTDFTFLRDALSAELPAAAPPAGLTPLGGGIVLLAYAAVAIIVAIAAPLRRDLR